MIDKIYQEAFAEKVINSPNTVVVDVFADWCGPCKMLSPVLEKLDSMNPDVDFYKVNIDENPSLADEFEVHVFEYAGHGTRRKEPFYESLQAMARPTPPWTSGRRCSPVNTVRL